jgi:hypothetical protein
VAVFEPEARSSAPGELVERPVGRETEEDFARSGIWNITLPCLSFTQPVLQGFSDGLILHRHPGL